MRFQTYTITGPCWRCKKPHTYDRRYPNTVCGDCRKALNQKGGRQ